MTQDVLDGLKHNTRTTDEAGEFTSLTYNALQMTKRVGAQNRITNYAYDKRNRLTKTTYDTSPQGVRDFTYDKVGNILTIVETDTKKNVTNTWDALNRFTDFGRPGQFKGYGFSESLKTTPLFPD